MSPLLAESRGSKPKRCNTCWVLSKWSKGQFFLVKRQGWIFSYDDVLSIWETWDVPGFATLLELFPHGKMFNL